MHRPMAIKSSQSLLIAGCRSVENPVEIESAVKRTVSPDMQQQLLNIPGWRGFNNPWMAEDDQDVEFSYINLVDNPERYTGYKVNHNFTSFLWYISIKQQGSRVLLTI